MPRVIGLGQDCGSPPAHRFYRIEMEQRDALTLDHFDPPFSWRIKLL
jgi:hypothetical protein